MNDDFDDFESKEIAGNLEPGRRVTVYCDGAERPGVLVHVYADGDVLVDYGNGKRDTVYRKWVTLAESDQDDFDFDDYKGVIGNYENARKFVEEHLTEDKGLWVLASYSRFHGGAVGKANVRYFQEKYPGVVQTRGPGSAFGEETVGIPEEKLSELDSGTMARIYDNLRSLTDSPILDEGFYAEAEREGQEKAWTGWIKQQFMSTLYSAYPQFEEALWALTAEQEYDLFEHLRDYAGAEWTEESDGDQVVDLDDIYETTNENILREFLHPGGEQLHLNLEALLEAIGDDDDEDLVKSLRGTGELKVKIVPGQGVMRVVGVDDDGETELGVYHYSGNYFAYGGKVGGYSRNGNQRRRWFNGQSATAQHAIKEILARQGWSAAVVDYQPKTESLLESREFSCLMAPASEDLMDAVLKWGQMFVTEDELFIDDNDPDEYGRERDPHVTVKFGLHEAVPSEALLKIIESTQPFEIEIGPASFFNSDQYDVLKFDVTGDGLAELNRRVSELACTDTHPEYHAHMTVAYVQRGCCADLAGKLIRETSNPAELRFLVKTVTFSSKDKNKYTLFLGKPNETMDGYGEVKEAAKPGFERRLRRAIASIYPWREEGAGAVYLHQEDSEITESIVSFLIENFDQMTPDTYADWVWDAIETAMLHKGWNVSGASAEDEKNLLIPAIMSVFPRQESLTEAEATTLVVHMDDRSTDFLKPIYDGNGYPVITGGVGAEELMEQIKAAPRIYAMGHGSPEGLYAMNYRGYIIGDELGPVLAAKKDGLYVWCNADAYAKRHGLSGIVSGMFISEVGEAAYFGLKATQPEVDASNQAFARIVREIIDRGDPYSMIRQCYGASNAACKITQFNAERLYVFEAGEPTPALHKSSASHREREQKEWEATRQTADEGQKRLETLSAQLAAAAQVEYDAWEQDEEGMDAELGAGGICQNIADAMADVLIAHSIEATIVDTSIGDQHVWVMARLGDVVYSVDIPASVYETGGGYNWKKRAGVTFEPEDVVITPEDVSWDELTESVAEPALA